MLKVTYNVPGPVFDYKRIDTTATAILYKHWWTGNLLYGYVDRFNTCCIAKEDILSIEDCKEDQKST